MIKKIIKNFTLILVILAATILPAPGLGAQGLEQTCQVDPNSDLCQDHNASGGGLRVFAIFRAIANMVSIIAAIAGVVMIGVGSFKYIRSSGDPSALSEAQNTIIYALIGLVVAAAGQVLVAFVLNRL